MVGIYFSGTGNTKYCIERFMEYYDRKSKSFSIEDEEAVNAIKADTFIVLAYPIYYSNLPKIMQDFIQVNGRAFAGKKVFLITSMGLFSGDGSGCAARILKKYSADVVGGLHIKMPDNIGDVKLLKKSLEQNLEIVKKADKKIQTSVERLKKGKPTRNGLGMPSHMLGLLGQRLWFYNKTRSYTDKLKIDTQKCTGCGRCQQICPMKNIKIENKKAISERSCTMCYRCISSCPQKAITLLGNKVIDQWRIE